MNIEKDYGGEELALNMDRAVVENQNFRTTIWTGEHMQITLMCIKAGSEIGLEKHETLDQMLYILEGEGSLYTGKKEEDVKYIGEVGHGYAIVIPAGYYHNVVNKGSSPIKLFSVYAPPAHAKGTIHRTKEDSDREHHY